MYCTHKECPENQQGQICTKELVSGNEFYCETRAMLECCKDCSYQCKTTPAAEVPTGCPLADEELGGVR